MRKALVIGTALFLVVLAVCLVPHRRSKVDALQDNLWTSSRDGWGSPVARGKEMEILDWNRTQYGIKWAWLVVDREVGGKGWSARMEPKAIIIYLLAAGLAGAVSFFVINRMAPRTDGIDNRLLLLAAIAILLLCLLPHRRSMKHLYQENLWTGGGWGSPVQQNGKSELKNWNRTQYGIKWAWLVVDREAGGEAWSARMEPKAIMVYLVPACGLAGAAYLIGRRRKRLVSR